MKRANGWVGVVLLSGFVLAGGPAIAEEAGLAVETVGDIRYMSGGIGSSEQEAMERVKGEYNLRLLFAVAGSGEFLADIGVTIADAAGNALLDGVSPGPYFYARVPPGRYRISADNAGQVQTRAVTIPASGATSEAFYWAETQ